MADAALLSLAYLTVDGAHPVAHIEAAAAAGFDAAGLRVFAPTHAPLADEVIGNPPLIRAIRDACRRTGVRLLDAEVMTLGARFDPQRLAPSASLAAELGFRFLQVVSEEPDIGRATDQFAHLCEVAKGYEVGVALEFMRFRAVATIHAAAALIGHAGASNAGVLLDPLHLARSGGGVEDVRAVGPEKIALLQLCDAPSAPPADGDLAHEARNHRLDPGEGALPLAALLRLMAPGMAISVEVPRADRRSLPPMDRARVAAAMARRFLDGGLD